MMPSTLVPARWPGGPPICAASNLPAFESSREAAAFLVKNNPSHPLPVVECDSCGLFHYVHERDELCGKYGTKKIPKTSLVSEYERSGDGYNNENNWNNEELIYG